MDDRTAETDGEVIAVPTDITDPAQVKTGFDQVRETFSSVDILLNSAYPTGDTGGGFGETGGGSACCLPISVRTVVGTGSPIELQTPVEYLDVTVSEAWTWQPDGDWIEFFYAISGEGIVVGNQWLLASSPSTTVVLQ